MSKKYDESSIKSLDWKDHIRLRPGMYIGKLGDGSAVDDGIYLLLKEIIDNSIDEYVMGHGKIIDVKVSENRAIVRDYGRGIPLGKVIECVSKINTGGKYDSDVFQKSVGLNGVGTKAVNALSSFFYVKSIRNGEFKSAEFNRGNIKENFPIEKTTVRNGTKITFIPDEKVFNKYRFISDYVQEQIWNYVYLNSGLVINFNGKKIFFKKWTPRFINQKDRY